MNLDVVPIHKHPEYLKDCCSLINEEWKRSDTARLHSLQSSGDHLPVSLILLHDKKLIGHLKLSNIPSLKHACFVESVVIVKELRGKGFGRFLMKKAEEYAQNNLCLNTVYLSTKGQEEFYKKLGYYKCTPISIYGSFIPDTKLQTKQNLTTQKDVPIPPPLPITNKLIPLKTYMKKVI